ncbi:MAG: cellulase family glycosylhydrolase [Bacteroidales bacterium]|nr:cellulase family glycosylhydrolase [Bacteroidales bacterium]
MKKLVYVFLCMIVVSSQLSLHAQKKSDFIKVEKNKLVIHDKPYYFCGTNFWYGYYLGSKGITGDRERLKRELDRFVLLGINNLRILAASEACTFEGTLKPAIQPSKGIYDEELLDGLDFLLAEMGKRKIYGVLFLNNFWQWSGGMSQYVSWTDGSEMIDPTQGDWNKFYDYTSSFYANQKANELWRQYIQMLVNRKNKYTGILYRDDPAIMSWQLANEPRGGEGTNGSKTIDDYFRWIDQSAAYIHSLDPNHLVSTGSEGAMGTKGNAVNFEKAHQSKHVDYLTFHLWAKNWGWFNGYRYNETLENSKTNAARYINEHVEVAKKLGKPIVMEEFGIDRDSSRCMPGTPVTARDAYFSFIFDLVAEHAKMDRHLWVPISGVGEAKPNQYHRMGK